MAALVNTHFAWGVDTAQSECVFSKTREVQVQMQSLR